MSYDYMLFRAAPTEDSVPERPSDLAPIGTFEEVAGQVERALPGIVWQRRGRDERVWLGIRPDPHVEVWLHVGMEPGDALVSSVTLSHVDRSVVERAADTLGLVALDTQKMVAYRPGRAGWEPGGRPR